jgi:O-antigen/teichoic acid export membrane protein
LLVAGTMGAFAVVLAAAALVAGPQAMSLLYGGDFDATREDLALLALGVGAFLAAGTFCQAMLARNRAGTAAVCWTAAAITFVALQLTLSGSDFHRVSVAFATASALAALMLFAAVWRGR